MAIPVRRRSEAAQPITSVRLYARPPSLRGVDLDALEDARSINDKPFGVLDLADGTRVFFAVVRTRSGLLRLNVQGLPERARATAS